MAGALIVTAELGEADFAWLNSLRRMNYPLERNHVPAHLTMFHALPPSAEGELQARLARLASLRPPEARIAGVMDLGGGVALRIISDDLDRLRGDMKDAMQGLLSLQDAGGWRPHVTIQNKVAPRIARTLISELEGRYDRRPIRISGLGLHRYLDGPWEKRAIYPFRGR